MLQQGSLEHMMHYGLDREDYTKFPTGRLGALPRSPMQLVDFDLQF